MDFSKISIDSPLDSPEPEVERHLSASVDGRLIIMISKDDSDPDSPVPDPNKLSTMPSQDNLGLPQMQSPILLNQKSSFHRWSVAIVAKIKTQLNADTETISIRTDIKYKLIFTIIVAFCGTAAAYQLREDKSAKYKFIAATMFFVLGLFFINFLYFVMKCKALHRIEVITARIKPDFGNIIFPIKIKQYPNEPVKSMSELFALRGTSIHLLFSFVCNTIGILVLLAILINWFDIVQNDYSNRWEKTHLANYFAVCGGIATPLMGNYDLNPNDQGHVAMHYIGVILMGVSVWSIGIVFVWDLFSIVLISITMFVLSIWVYLSTFHYPDRIELKDNMSKQDVKRITHKISLTCVIAETVGCMFASLCNITYVWYLHDTAQD